MRYYGLKILGARRVLVQPRLGYSAESRDGQVPARSRQRSRVRAQGQRSSGRLPEVHNPVRDWSGGKFLYQPVGTCLPSVPAADPADNGSHAPAADFKVRSYAQFRRAFPKCRTAWRPTRSGSRSARSPCGTTILHLSLAFDTGFDWVSNPDPGTPYSGWLRKFTIAQQIGAKPEFFARPVLRIFATYGNWSEAFVGRVGGAPFISAKAGFTAGVQAETWW